MKLLSIFVSVSTIFVCGNISAFFWTPDRYIKRDVTLEEMVGTWNATPESEVDVKTFVAEFPDWDDGYLHFSSITLNGDGSCRAEHKGNWLDEVASSDTSMVYTTSCSWDLSTEENLNGKWSPVIRLVFEYANNYGWGQSLYIYEENDELIIWSFIGDPDDIQRQDFVKGK